MNGVWKTFDSACSTRCEVSTNCPMGGDSGHGGRTSFRIDDEGSTDMGVTVRMGEEEEHFDFITGIELHFGGDAEAENLVAILDWASKRLSEIMKENKP